MFRLNRPQIQPIGVDIGHDSVKMLQLEVREETLAVRASARRMLDVSAASAVQPSPAELIFPQAAQAIDELLRGGDFVGRTVVASLPRHIVHVKNMRLPPMPPSEVEAVVQFEAKSIFPFDISNAHVDFLVAGEVRQGTDVRQEVVVLAAQHADADRFVEQLHRTGLIVDSLDVEPCSLYRTIDRFVRRREDEQEVHVLVDVGARCTQVLIGKGRDVSFFKSIEIGGADFNLAVSRKLGIRTDEARALRRRMWENAGTDRPDTVRQAVLDSTRSTMENLTREICLCLRYHSVTFRGQRPLKVQMSGGEGGEPQLLAMLHTSLAIPIEPARPLYNVDCSVMRDVDRRAPSGEWTVALGLALKRTRGKFAPLDGTPRAAAPATPAKSDPRVPAAEPPGSPSREAVHA
ncbi:MAG TPA: pilus assembly protein PilM [Tepidisphaeraceae bacterium]|jgi:type IV pilus assembly protein PilM|nr:pilus assembly protein PilM [Tepidisphaeraceae bacterium]